ncbi:MAG: WYL domain-containing protein [Myxococcales bacterium]|nr:WYL domain-containing protein [Myxococcales bacterium]
MRDLNQRLRILLFLVPYVVRNRGASLAELSRRLGMPEAELRQEIDFLLMIGQPPFAPDDLIEIYEEAGRVYVHLHQSFDRPVNFTLFEALALVCAGRMFCTPAMGDAAVAMEGAISRILSALPPEMRRLVADLAERFVFESGEAAPHLSVLRHAVEERREVDIRHFSAGRGEVIARSVRPLGLHLSRGHWYLVAFCTRREAVRVFRLTRIQQATLTDRIFDPMGEIDVPGTVEAALRLPPRGSREVVMSFSPAVARWVREKWGGEGCQPEPDGGLRLHLFDVSDEFALSYAASFAGEARILSPPQLAERLRDEARVLAGGAGSPAAAAPEGGI